MRRLSVLALVACGCRGILGIEQPIEVPDDGNAIGDAAGDAPPVCSTWHPEAFDPCALGPPLPALRLTAGAYLLDTSSGRLLDAQGAAVATSTLAIRQADGSELAVLSVASLTVDADATLNVTGRAPALIVAWSTITVAGAIDASSHVGITDLDAHIAQTVRSGPGAGRGCGDSAGKNGIAAMAATTGSGGGGGGALQGQGGNASTGGEIQVSGGAGGRAVAPSVLRGGCPGGFSGAAGDQFAPPATPGTRASGGAGGGGIRLVAHDAIAVTGAISANGAGGAGAPKGSSCGGGGGGSGGSVELEAPAIDVAGALSANGGGGGGGGGGPADASTAGFEGADGALDVVAAPGGARAASGCGAPGGPGSSQTQLAGATAPVAGSCSGGRGGGGGGGGGGAGFIAIASPAFTATSTAKISPPELRVSATKR